MYKVGNLDGQPTLVNAPFGRAVAELSRKGGHLDHIILADSCEVIYIAAYRKYFSISFTNVTH